MPSISPPAAQGVLSCLFATVLLLGGCAERGQALGSEPETESVALDIDNRTGRPLRCLVILAHFITRDIGPIPPDGMASLELSRYNRDGSLGFGHHKSEPMMVENILCGRADHWQETVTDLPLPDIRTGHADRFLATCRTDRQLACTVSGRGD